MANQIIKIAGHGLEKTSFVFIRLAPKLTREVLTGMLPDLPRGSKTAAGEALAAASWTAAAAAVAVEDHSSGPAALIEGPRLRSRANRRQLSQATSRHIARIGLSATLPELRRHVGPQLGARLSIAWAKLTSSIKSSDELSAIVTFACCPSQLCSRCDCSCSSEAWTAQQVWPGPLWTRPRTATCESWRQLQTPKVAAGCSLSGRKARLFVIVTVLRVSNSIANVQKWALS